LVGKFIGILWGFPETGDEFWGFLWSEPNELLVLIGRQAMKMKRRRDLGGG
jgi:hypothetical protein